MGKINKRSSSKVSVLQQKKNKVRDIFEFSESEKQFIIETFLKSNSPAIVQSLYIKEFPKSATPSYKLISKLAAVGSTRHVGLPKSTETHPQTECGEKNAANKILTPIMDSSNVSKRTKIQSRVNFKQSKKKSKYRKVLNNRLSQLFEIKTCSANTSAIDHNEKSILSGSLELGHPLKENVQSCNVDNVNCSGIGILQGNVSNFGKKRKRQNIDIGKHSFIETISLDSPRSKIIKDAPIICEIDLTSSPNLNNNTVYAMSDNSNKYGSSTPFNFKYRSYANMASLSNIESLSPIKKKQKSLVDNVESSKKCGLMTCKDDDPFSFVTIDQSVGSEISQNDHFVKTIRNLENEENSVDSSNVTIVTKDYLTKKKVEILPVQSIDLTEDNVALNIREDISNAKAPSNQLIYDLTLDQNDSVALKYTLSTLEKKRTCLIEALADTVKDSTARLTKKGHVNRNGSNIYFPGNHKDKERTGLRMVVIDGSNVALSHRHGKFFSVEGLKICIDYFLNRGHEVKTFVPRFRNKKWKSSNPRLLDQLEQAGHVVYTPSREIKGRCIASYDDRYIVQCAVEFQGVIVSGDNYRDLLLENESWRETIEQRLLPFTWVGDMLMFPQDPLGKNGPKLAKFLSHSKHNK